MDKSENSTADALRERFRAIPSEARSGDQAFSVRVWRGLSWLQRSEGAPDTEGRFISLWIAFNAIYGQLQDDGLSAPDHAAWQGFLAQIARADGHDRLGEILWAEQLYVLRLIDNKYLFRPFWLRAPDADEKLARSRKAAMLHLQNRSTVGVLEEVFERLYVLRQQVFHGAATSGSKLNRGYLKGATRLLARIVPAMIAIMIDSGPGRDWGEICFPPTED